MNVRNVFRMDFISHFPGQFLSAIYGHINLLILYIVLLWVFLIPLDPVFLFVKPIFHLATLFARTDKKVGTLPTCSRRIFSPANFNQSRQSSFIYLITTPLLHFKRCMYIKKVTKYCEKMC